VSGQHLVGQSYFILIASFHKIVSKGAGKLGQKMVCGCDGSPGFASAALTVSLSTQADGKCFLLCTVDLHEEQACGSRAQYCCSSLSQQNGLPGHQHAKARFRTRSPQPNAAPQGAPATARLNATGGANHQRKTPSTRLARSSPAFEPKSSWAPRQKHSRRAALRAIRARLPPVLASTFWTQGTGPDGKFPDQKRPTV